MFPSHLHRLFKSGGTGWRDVRMLEAGGESTTAILNQYNIKWANLSSADKENYGTFKRKRERLRGRVREMGGILRMDERRGRETPRTGPS